jgi:hypothetical protein
LQVLRELKHSPVPCMVVNLDDAHARLLGQALNRIQGEDDLGLRAELLRVVLQALPQRDVLNLLPETTQSLQAMASLGQEDMARHLQNWQQAQGARLRHLACQLLPDQLAVVEETLSRLLPLARQAPSHSPNARGTALYLLCLGYLEREERRV